MKKAMMLTTTAYMSERFNRNNILILEEMGYEVHVVANFDRGNPSTREVLDEFKKWVLEHHGKCFTIAVTKHPTDLKHNRKAYRQILALIRENQYDFIHCHTPVGGVLGRMAGHRTHTKVLYTAHGFHFFDGAPMLNWTVYYPVEKFLSRWTDILITINQEDYQRAKKHFHAKKTVYVPGVGIDLEAFSGDRQKREEKRRELGLKDSDIMLLSVGELSKRKNHEIVIRALEQLKRQGKLGNIHYMICGTGGLQQYLEQLVHGLSLDDAVHFLGYRTDIPEICQSADLYIFPSLQEGLPVALMEAIAAKTPVIGSRIRGNTDLIVNESCLFDPNDADDVALKITDAITNGITGAVQENYEHLKAFELQKVNQRMRLIYIGEYANPKI
jgi:glycosyltransferase involved in cell wall biosynthesis